MNDITATSITVYNDTTSQNNTVSSLTNYKNSINIIFRKKVSLLIYFVLFFHIDFLTQSDPTYLQECSPTEPASKLPTGYSCQFTWTDIITSESN